MAGEAERNGDLRQVWRMSEAAEAGLYRTRRREVAELALGNAVAAKYFLNSPLCQFGAVGVLRLQLCQGHERGRRIKVYELIPDWPSELHIPAAPREAGSGKSASLWCRSKEGERLDSQAVGAPYNSQFLSVVVLAWFAPLQCVADIVVRIPAKAVILHRIGVCPIGKQRSFEVLLRRITDDCSHRAEKMLVAGAAHGAEGRVCNGSRWLPSRLAFHRIAAQSCKKVDLGPGVGSGFVLRFTQYRVEISAENRQIIGDVYSWCIALCCEVRVQPCDEFVL